MFYVTRDERIFSKKDKIDLENVVRIDFHNTGSVDVKVGLVKVKASEKYVYQTGGNVTKNGVVNIKFDNNLEGELYADIKRFSSCLHN